MQASHQIYHCPFFYYNYDLDIQTGHKNHVFSDTWDVQASKQAINITQCHIQMPWLWSCTTSRHQNPSEKPSCILPYLMEATGSLNQHGFSNSSAEEHLENKLKQYAFKYRHVFALISLQNKGKVFFQAQGARNRTSSYKKGLLSCDRIFYIPRQYKIQTPTANTTEEGRTVLIALCYLPHLQMPEIIAVPVTLSMLA